ncbi:hypothetical protein [Vulcanisaeta souniana]|uniref:hypothetical protein n=1 Tax=Vulcanisaeta souniana TaxID=164452 RepID=UPI001FB4F08B|nr:hypothetical protein [Vulcanisaeta souniana]
MLTWSPYRVGDVILEDVMKAFTRIYHGDARKLDLIRDGSVDAVFTHPLLEHH